MQKVQAASMYGKAREEPKAEEETALPNRRARRQHAAMMRKMNRAASTKLEQRDGPI